MKGKIGQQFACLLLEHSLCYIDLGSLLSHVYVRVSNHKSINIRPILETWGKSAWEEWMASRPYVFSLVMGLDDITSVLLLYQLHCF